MRKLLLPALTAAALVGSFVVPGSAAQPEARPGVITSASARSATLGEDINYNVYLPAGYGDSTGRYPVHGRGDTMAAWTQMKSRLDELIGSGEIPPTIAVMPDAPWSSRGSYYVDSAYTGADRGRPVETAFFRDLVPHVDASYRTIADRNGRAVAGYSMGGAGALRYAMAHPEVFGASIALSPAVYFPLPPADSSAREFGAFGKGKDPFSEAVYLRSNYPAAFKSFAAKGLPSHLYIAVGDDEWKNPKPIDYTHDLDFEAHIVFNQAVRVPNLTSEFRVVDGGHDWDVWRPTFADGAKYIFQYIGKPPAVPMKAMVTGTAGEDRAGGIATDASGNVYQAAAVEGSLDGTPYAGGKDVTLTKYAPDGTREWTRSIGTSGTERAYGVAVDSQGRIVVTGYTTGDLDGAHAGNTTDDAFAVQYDAAGNQRWIRQFGVPGVADRSYSVAVDGDATYLGGYTKGSLAGTNAGDKDVFLARLDGDGQQVWLRQVGSAGEEKGMAVAVSGGSVYLAGMTAGAMGTSIGGVDGFVTRYSTDGDAVWLKQFGTSASDEAWGLAADPNGGVYLTGYTAGDFSGALAGDKDIIVARVDGDGVLTWRDQFGTTANDKGAAVAVDGSGNAYVAGFTDGAVETSIGRFDGVLAKYSPDLTRTWTRQFGTTEDDAADPFAEANVYLTTTQDGTQVSGLTATDVFRTAFSADGENEAP